MARAVAGEIDKTAAKLAARSDPALQAIGVQLASATADLQAAIDWMVPAYGQHARAAHAGAVAYLKLWGLAVGGWQMARAAQIASEQLAAGDGNPDFLRAKIATARFYTDVLLPQTSGARARDHPRRRQRARAGRRGILTQPAPLPPARL